MDDSPRFDEISTEDFRGLQEAPLASDAATASAARADDLTDEAGARLDRDTLEADLDDEVLTDNEDISAGLSTSSFDVVLQSDMEGDEIETNSIHASDMDAPDAPGEIDIEDLPDNALDLTGIPADALLDPIEE